MASLLQFSAHHLDKGFVIRPPFLMGLHRILWAVQDGTDDGRNFFIVGAPGVLHYDGNNGRLPDMRPQVPLWSELPAPVVQNSNVLAEPLGKGRRLVERCE